MGEDDYRTPSAAVGGGEATELVLPPAAAGAGGGIRYSRSPARAQALQRVPPLAASISAAPWPLRAALTARLRAAGTRRALSRGPGARRRSLAARLRTRQRRPATGPPPPARRRTKRTSYTAKVETQPNASLHFCLNHICRMLRCYLTHLSAGMEDLRTLMSGNEVRFDGVLNTSAFPLLNTHFCFLFETCLRNNTCLLL